MIPHAGRYMFHYDLQYEDPSGELRFVDGGGRGCNFAAATPPGSPASQPGGETEMIRVVTKRLIGVAILASVGVRLSHPRWRDSVSPLPAAAVYWAT